MIRACSRTPRLSTGCLEQTRWKEHTEPTWYRWDRVCSSIKRNTQRTLTEATWHRLDRPCSRAPFFSGVRRNTPNRQGRVCSVLARGRHVSPRDAWRKQDGKNTLNRHGTDWIVLARGDKSWCFSLYITPRCSTRHIGE